MLLGIYGAVGSLAGWCQMISGIGTVVEKPPAVTVAVPEDAQIAAIKVYSENGALGVVLLTAVIVILLLGIMLWRVISMYRSLQHDVLTTNSTNLQVVQTLAGNIASVSAKVDVLLAQQTRHGK
jgi:predicted negative regulator of RcsB-dependent stress response